jgi:hypothetical protein
MGIDVAAFKFLIDNHQYIKGDTLQLGRQGLHYAGDWADKTGQKAELSNKILTEANLKFKAQDTVEGGDGHTEKLFKLLGAQSVETVDYSPYEGASITHDLNVPVLDLYHDKFDFIYDSGTIEHIFDVKTVTENIKSMLRLNGVVAIITVCNNFPGHGFYQFSPEFFRTVFSEQAGFKELSLDIYELIDDGFRIWNVPKPGRGQRQEFKTSNNPHYVAFAAQKINNAIDTNFQQSDYVAIWGGK